MVPKKEEFAMGNLIGIVLGQVIRASVGEKTRRIMSLVGLSVFGVWVIGALFSVIRLYIGR